MNSQPSSPNNVLDNVILLSSDTNSLNANNGSQEIGDNNVVPQAPTKSVGMGKGLFMHNTHKKQYPRINLEKLMQDDAQATKSPFRGIGEEKIWEKIRKPLSPKLRLEFLADALHGCINRCSNLSTVNYQYGLDWKNIPLEAWSVDGISALASSLGNPLIMESMTATMCHKGFGRLDYARVLVEMDAMKEFKKTIEIQYRDQNNKVKGTKMVHFTYDWKPSACTHCKVFGHEFQGCNKRPRTAEEESERVSKEEEKISKTKHVETDFEIQGRRKANGNMQGNTNGKQKEDEVNKRNRKAESNGYRFENRFTPRFNNQEYRKKQTNKKEMGKDRNKDGNSWSGKQWNIQDNESKAMKQTANNVMELSKWTPDMIKYFQDQEKKDRRKESNAQNLNDGSTCEEDIVEAMIGRVLTQDKIISWGTQSILLCPLCNEYRKTGGLSIGSIYGLNDWLLFKWIWSFFHNSSDLWIKVIKNLYGQHGDIFDVSTQRSSLSPWCGILSSINSLNLKGIDLFALCIRKLGNGVSIRFWEDVWSGNLPLKAVFPRIYMLDTDRNCNIANHVSLQDWNQVHRRIPRGGIEASQPADLKSLMGGVVLSDQNDSWNWSLDVTKGFSVASACSLIDSHFLEVSPTATRWNNSIPIKVNIFLWKLLLNKLPSRL
ncbi:RNA-directed DNA polymerase, eukaryota, Reverse transcriptase zinc-binding domain protein [Artemisia annua]|uniref:RNA-directed DNA polymerase, eukaryota, Reverse transcriptase zinc-binding domain protein n=1 Tax=Artemisia annua TaxID=35608 RepID=A0A2U1N676_ARTAN|nr:RNA-directed DNA polymerase, eukaryota, Reverse transcriptase zinc-binding domain protein [Artemisia annua]